MKLIKQFAVIFSIYSISDILSKTLKLPIPGNVIGMMLLFFLLLTGIVKESNIDEASELLIANMSLLFIPGTLAIIDEYQYVKAEIIPFVIICIFMAVIIMIATGLSAQFFENFFSKFRK
ncbi:CidA/LrgA family protein [Brachyspira hyodysenteriae]|uniref:CidA/LrgA family protein n=1 Tax=Brachyspira hyodysenteriae TaxID=159 RepID=UPI00063D9FBD|nr:CidA/LrgA family protein [Brachyspira hyodysenteriae]KLI45528.1 hydrogenase [Brachyspira hyodysenteriae]